MKTRRLKELTTRKGHKFYVLNRVEGTTLNHFCEEDVMYDIVDIDGKKRCVTKLGIKNIIKFF